MAKFNYMAYWQAQQKLLDKPEPQKIPTKKGVVSKPNINRMKIYGD